MKTNFFSNTAPVIPTGAKRSGGISRLTHHATIKAGAHVRRFLGKLGMTVILLSPVVLLSAQPGVTITGLAVEAGTVTLDVRWEPLVPPVVWSDTVWVFVDHNVAGVMKRLPLTGATLTNPSAAATATVPLPNNKGAWVAGNARIAGSFSAKVKLYYDSQTAVAGACAYASNYPPVAEYRTASSITFTGTPLFDLKLSTGNVSVQTGYELVGSQTLVSFTDKTGAPGIIKCIPPATYSLIASASGFCENEAGITFALSGTQLNVKYQLYRGSDKVGSELTGTGGGAATFTTGGPFKEAGTYTAQSVADGLYCPVAMSGSYSITANATPTAPIISQPADVCENAGALVFTITGYSGTPTWVNNGGGTENGLSVTFASGASTGTKTVIAKSSQTYTKAETCHSAEVTQTGTIHALPTVTGSEGASRCGSGTVTLNATASVGVIDWYNVATDGTVLDGGSATNSFTTPILTSSATYYAQARNTSTNCVSASRTEVEATVHTAPTGPTGLTSNVLTICNGVSTSATLTADGGNLGSGAEYRWSRGATVDSDILATTSGNTYSVSPDAATTYWVRLVGNTSCTGATTGVTTSIAVHGAISPGSITTTTATTDAGTAPSNPVVANEGAASGGSGNFTYLWLRTNTSTGSPATLTGNGTAYTMIPSDYEVAGTYRFNRYAKDNTCTTYPAVAAYGTYTLYVNCPASSTVTLCTKCCYSGSAWVDCYVTTNAYPFADCTTNTPVVWSGNGTTYYSGASGKGSDKNGRVNTTNISSTGTSAVQLCKNLGTGWYLPAYEELVAMSDGSELSPLNGLSGAGLILLGHHWSSTEYYDNGGRYTITHGDNTSSAMITDYTGKLGHGAKAAGHLYVRCAWRN